MDYLISCGNNIFHNQIHFKGAEEDQWSYVPHVGGIPPNQGARGGSSSLLPAAVGLYTMCGSRLQAAHGKGQHHPLGIGAGPLLFDA